MGTLLKYVFILAAARYSAPEIFKWMASKAIESTERGIVSNKKLNNMFRAR